MARFFLPAVLVLAAPVVHAQVESQLACPPEEPSTGTNCAYEGLVCTYGNQECCYFDATADLGACSCGPSLQCACSADLTFGCYFTERCQFAELHGGKFCGTSCDGCDPPLAKCPKDRMGQDLDVAYDPSTPQECEDCRKFRGARYTKTTAPSCDGWRLLYTLEDRANITATACSDSLTITMEGPQANFPFTAAERAYFGKIATQVSKSLHAVSPGSLDMLTVAVSLGLKDYADNFPVNIEINYPYQPGYTPPSWFEPDILPNEDCLPENTEAGDGSAPGTAPLVGKASPRTLGSSPPV